MAEPRWLKGELTGTCVGKPARRVGGSGLARWYKLELVDAVIGSWAPVAGPPKGAAEGAAPFCQAALRDARLRAPTPGGSDEELSLRELSIWNWKMRDQRESGGESRCTLVGTVYAMEVAGTRRPALAEGADRLGRAGCLGLLLGLMAAFWLWWSCGPFTCGLWSSVVLVSAWSHRQRTRRRTPPGLASKIAQGILALVLILGGVGLVLGMTDPARAAACTEQAALAVLLGVGMVVAASLLTVSWPLPWIWAVWTAVVVLWCGRSGTDCAGLWLKRTQQAVLGVAPARPFSPGDLLPSWGSLSEILPTGGGHADGGSMAKPSADAGSGGTGTGSGGTGTGSGGTGTGSGGTGTGSGGTGTGSGGTGTGSGGTGTGSGGTGTGSGGTGTGSGGTGTGSGQKGSGAALDDDEPLEAAQEPRMSVDTALSDPKTFLDGSARVTLSGDLLFAFDEDHLKPEAEPKLRQVARLLRVDPRQRVLLEGHSDTIGGDQYNQDLSERRAQAVRTWLVEQAHINPLQIDTVGYGAARPVVPTSRGPAAQAANRRVEVRALGASSP